MTAQSPILTPLAVENAEVLHALRHGIFDTPTELAKRLDRDPSNMRRTLKSLEAAGLVQWPSLTEAGKAAHDAIQRAESPNAPPPRTNTGDILMLRHDQIRPNPSQPREVDESDPVQDQKLDELAATIASAGRVLQNLVVFPAGADGVHELSAGERRWRAVGRLIERGVWPADRTLPAMQTEAVIGQAEFIALIENGQREGLHPVEEMKAYAQLIDSRPLSARQAALETGRDVRTVQEMMKVWREADRDDIEACRRGELTWEQLRNSVKEAKAPAPDQAPIQADIEDVAPAQPAPAQPARQPIIGGAGAGASMPPKPIPDPAAPDAVLTPDQRRTMAELDFAVSTRPSGYAADGTPYVACGQYWLDEVAAELKALRLIVFMHTGGIFAAFTKAGQAWCDANVGPHELDGEPVRTPWLKLPEDATQEPPHVAADLTAPPVAANPTPASSSGAAEGDVRGTQADVDDFEVDYGQVWPHSAFTASSGGTFEASFETTLGRGKVWFDHEDILRISVQDAHGHHAFRLRADQVVVLQDLLFGALDSFESRPDALPAAREEEEA